jgi:hypothetical protein
MKKQKTLFDYSNDPSSRKRYARQTRGGISKKPARKLERPLSRKDFIHLVLKSEKSKRLAQFLET